MDRLLQFLLKTFVRRGTFRVTTSRGTIFTFGDGTGQPVCDSLYHAARPNGASCSIPSSSSAKPTWTARSWSSKARSPTCSPSCSARTPTAAALGAAAMAAALPRTAASQQFNPRTRARRNVAHHYDLDGRLYSLFLDADRQYSCAYFETPDQSLDDAQLAKKRHLAAKLLLDAAASACSTSAAAGAGLASISPRSPAPTSPASRCRRSSMRSAPTSARRKRAWPSASRFDLQDYRDVAGPFDRIVSVGMFEHVGVDHLRRVLPQDARELLDRRRRDAAAFDRPLGRARASPIPGSPNTSSPAATSRRCRRCCRAIERVRPAGHRHRDPAPALRRDAARPGASASSPTARRSSASTTSASCGCGSSIWPPSEMAFREQNMMVFQIQLTKRQGVVPMTRDYIAREEAAAARARRRAAAAAAAGRRIDRAPIAPSHAPSSVAMRDRPRFAQR